MFNYIWIGRQYGEIRVFSNENSKPDFLNTVNDVSNGSDKTKPNHN